jgi:GNAT superfamily N-acetyltransferase
VTTNASAVRRAQPEDAAAIAQVRVDSWRTTYKGMIPDAYLAAMKVDASAAMWERVLTAGANTTSTFVADDAGEVVGFASGLMLAERKFDLDAELSAIYLRQDRQRTGTGRRLLCAGNKAARAFYEVLGAELLVEQPFQWDGMDLVEAGYGWRDLDALSAACSGATPSGQ